MNASKKKFFLNLALAAVLVLSFSSFGMDYFVREIESGSARVVEAKQSVYVLRSRSSQLAAAKQSYGEVQDKLERAFETIIDDDRTVDFIKAAEAAARENKVKWEIEAVGNKAAAKPGVEEARKEVITSSDFTFKIGGSFENVMKFLYTLENFQYDVDISEVKMSFGDFDEYNQDLILAEFKLKLYQKDSQQ